MRKEELLIGAHTSIQGGLHHALEEGVSLGATTIQCFTANQRQWASKPLDPEAICTWKETISATGLKKIMSHASYLINLGSPKKEVRSKSLHAFKKEIERCLSLEISFLNFHPGAALDSPIEECLDHIVEALCATEPLFSSSSSLCLLLETTAGQGTCVGFCLEHLAYLLEKLHKRIPLGVCIDTCHIFAAGYDISTEPGLHDYIEQFDKVIGLKHLYALHMNDSAKELGSRVDRHAHLGKGKIGLEGFKAIMQHPALSTLPKYLETPYDPEVWKQEIALLRNFFYEKNTH